MRAAGRRGFVMRGGAALDVAACRQETAARNAVGVYMRAKAADRPCLRDVACAGFEFTDLNPYR